MTTQELKSYIDRILGNNIRLLLPSYWWKRMFGAIVDKIDEVGQGFSIVDNKDALKKLDLPNGSIASVAGGLRSFSECYLVKSEEEFNNITDASIFTKIEEIQIVGNKVQNNWAIFFGSSTGYSVFMVSDVETNTIAAQPIIPNSTSGELLYLMSGGITNNTALSELNSFLAENDVRFIAAIEEPETNTDFNTTEIFSHIDKVLKWTGGTDAYIKEEKEWSKLLKEEDMPKIDMSVINDKQDKLVSGSNIKTVCGESVLGIGNLIPDPSMKVYIPMGGTLDSYNINNQGFYRRIVDGGNWTNSWRAIARTAEGNRELVLLGVSYNPTDGCRVLVSGYQDSDITDRYEAVLLSDGSVSSVTKVEAGGGESCSCIEEVIFYAADNTRGYSLTADEKAKNVEAFNKQWEAYQNKTPLNRVVCVRGDVTLYMPVVYFLPSDTSTFNVVKGATLEEFYVYVNSDGSATYSESRGVDDTLSTTSTKPVQNKVVTAALNEKADRSYVDNAVTNVTIAVDSELSETSENPVQNKVVYGELVDLALAIDDLGVAFDARLELQDNAINLIDEKITTKQDTITDLATIRSNAAKGATALQSVPSEYITESELNAKNYATATQLTAKQDIISDLATIRSNAVLGSTAIQKVKTINGEPIVGEGDVELFTKEMHDTLIEEMLANEEVYAAGVNDLNSRLNETNAALSAEVSARESLSAEVAAINTSIVENEEVIAATLNDLLARIDALTIRVEQLENA